MEGEIKVKSKAHGTTHVVDTTCGGCSFTISPHVEVIGETTSQGITVEAGGKAPEVMAETAENVQNKLGHEFGVKLKVIEEIPRPLGYLEAVSCATANIVCILCSKKYGSGMHRLRLNKKLARDFYLVDGRIIPLPELLDCCLTKQTSRHKTASSFYGGFTVYVKEKLTRRGDMEEDLKGLCVLDDGIKLFETPKDKTLLDEAVKNKLYQASNHFCWSNAGESAEKYVDELRSQVLFQSLNA
ncbi:MAG: hypothetical protein GF334_00030, partial [Candidatus Altiarchaeales archaeon]|nr:hypothetical protein [Candidatus Altiarchaeales archaeon]